MDFFKNIFGSRQRPSGPPVSFGRYSESLRIQEKEHVLEQSAREFENNQPFQALDLFFQYLSDDARQNVKTWSEGPEKFCFELFQGSKKVSGYADSRKLLASARIAHAKALSPGFMQRLLEENFNLNFSRFALTPGNDIVILFDTYLADASPYKLYSALKELATHADKHDDLLLDEFEDLEPVDFFMHRELPAAEKELKYNYIVREIAAVFQEIDQGRLHADQYPLAGIYLLLNLCYKLDYLIRPEGYLMEALERIHRIAFEEDQSNAARKALLLRKEFQKILDRPREKFFRELYEGNATFGITEAAGHDKVALVIEQELPNMKWYQEHGHDRVALSIPGFIIGNCLFNLALPLPDRELFHLLMQVLESGYFCDMGFEPFVKNGIPDKKAVRRELREMAGRHRSSFPGFDPDPGLLDYSSLPAFAASFLWMVKDLDMG
ncbi:MAG: hypothetical protein RI973_2251 [Bacteroidota bacterium]|jgi:hypothetical protein